MNMSITSNLQKTNLAKIIGNRIRTLRKSRKMSIEELAFMSDMEYAQLSRIERGVVNCTTYQLYKIFLSLNQQMVLLFENIEVEIKSQQ
jgi:XRE family transcriptional regulator, regulator of sulfur utilization